MNVVFSEKAKKELDDIDQSLRKLFIKHTEKIITMPLKRHMRFGLPYNVEEVTKQARIIYNFEGDTCYILRCFKTHKEYERWYKSFK